MGFLGRLYLMRLITVKSHRGQHEGIIARGFGAYHIQLMFRGTLKNSPSSGKTGMRHVPKL